MRARRRLDKPYASQREAEEWARECIIRAGERNRLAATGIPPLVGLRVVSLFDGIGGMAQVLRQLGMPVEKYTACEKEPNARRMAKHANPRGEAFGGVDHMGLGHDVTGITEEDIINLGRVYVFAMAPPCQELAKVRKRPGRDGRPARPRLGIN